VGVPQAFPDCTAADCTAAGAGRRVDSSDPCCRPSCGAQEATAGVQWLRLPCPYRASRWRPGTEPGYPAAAIASGHPSLCPSHAPQDSFPSDDGTAGPATPEPTGLLHDCDTITFGTVAALTCGSAHLAAPPRAAISCAAAGVIVSETHLCATGQCCDVPVADSKHRPIVGTMRRRQRHCARRDSRRPRYHHSHPTHHRGRLEAADALVLLLRPTVSRFEWTGETIPATIGVSRLVREHSRIECAKRTNSASMSKQLASELTRDHASERTNVFIHHLTSTNPRHPYACRNLCMSMASGLPAHAGTSDALARFTVARCICLKQIVSR
jgi:hypothetical protein